MDTIGKIHRLGKWMHFFMLGLLLAFMMLTYPEMITESTFVLYYTTFFDFVVFAGAAYFVAYFLLPRFFLKGKYLPFFSWYLLALVVGTTLILINDIILISLNPNPAEKDRALKLVLFFGSTLGMIFMISAVGVGIRGFIYWIISMQQLNAIQQENLKTELAFLRSQMNPHFLFNTINLVFGYIDRSNTAARDIMVKFSELLRYQLYECDEPSIPIDKEISYLQNYIELHKMRKSDNLDCTVELSDKLHSFSIAPFLIIPIVENAFKYVSYEKGKDNYLRIVLDYIDGVFKFTCVNTKSAVVSKEVIDTKGLGLNNVRRRLQLMYPDRHTLDIDDAGSIFTVKLTIAV